MTTETMSSPSALAPSVRIETRILLVRGQKVIIDADLAELYGVPTKALNQAVKRNAQRFPQDFMFQLTSVEKQEVVTNCDHLSKLKFSKTLPFAFTEHGAIQAANIINSDQAVEIGVYVVRAFVRLRELVLSNKDLAQRFDELENKTDLMELKHDTFEHNTRLQLKQVLEAIRELMTQPELESVKKRSIGFIEQDEKPSKPSAAKAKNDILKK
ncbi:ORF6N domain-containing protein [Undibacterium sp. RTI2.1]|uniref:ORF6N domain-containing protein n=1 Tax=unclassified Undibacterium TaxID=2630295 RepID=UPI002B23629B|nr:MULTISPECIES: ORF6N domain-containing protein [unclassified Undibacterium]MEB0031357.1 ORF6N domain-containing protein [Undibacterium sp. RTI2.1]MEB0117668.1 ORF6N domain-containing protein [Undibacterium sp. RTI2.2]